MIHFDIAFNARVFDLRDRACRQLHCGAGSRYQLWKYNRALRVKGEQLCGSAVDLEQASKGTETLWYVPPTHLEPFSGYTAQDT